MKKLKSPRFLMVFAMASFGTLGIFVRHIVVSSGELALYRALLASVMLGIYLAVTGKPFKLNEIRRELLLLLFSGMALGANWILLFEAYRYTTVSVATLSYYFAPVLVTLACPILFRERMSPMKWLCFAGSTAGIVLITGLGDPGAGKAHLTGIFFALGAAVLYAGVVLLNKYIKSVADIQRTFLQFLAASAVLIPYVVCTTGVNLGKLDAAGWLCLLTVGLFHTGVLYCLYFSALRHLPGQETAILSYMDPLVAVLVSVFVLNEPMDAMQLVGGFMILGFTLCNEISLKTVPGSEKL